MAYTLYNNICSIVDMERYRQRIMTIYYTNNLLSRKNKEENMVLSLNGKWEFKEKDSNNWLPAKVPGSNYLDLIQNKVIEHPFEGTNESDAQWVADKDWQYRREFEVDEELISSDIIELVFKGLDALATVFINDSLVLSSDNGLRRHFVDIKPFIKKGINTILISFLSPVEFIKQKNKIYRFPPNMNGINGVPHIRKNQSHFGWDWGPTLPMSGISDDVYIKATKSAVIIDTHIKQKHNDKNVTLEVDLNVNLFAKDRDVLANIEVISPDKKNIINKSIKVVQEKTSFSLTLDNPELWYCNGLGDNQKQPLYELIITLREDNKQIDSRTTTIGLRTIELDLSKDKWGNKFQFKVNGIPIFAKGANWIPQDSLQKINKEGLEKLLLSMRDCNMNMIRVWGGGYYESDYFYDLCDKFGILVWQDFCFACMPYDFDNIDFITNLRDEVIDNVIRLRNRASLALWCGNNEIELLSKIWFYRRKLINSTKEFFYNILPNWLSSLDNERPYWTGSPSSGEYLKDVNSDNIGDTHLWQVWHGLRPYNYYRKRFTRFCSEFGFESFPDIRTIKSFAKESEFDIKSDTMINHQKCNSGNQKILFYSSMRFRIPKKFEDLIYISQVTQMECIKDATEHWRRNRERCYGSLFWQLNDCWPVSSWSSIDYYGRWKALQYASKKFNAPVTISICDEGHNIDLSVVNDTIRNKDLIIEWGLVGYEGSIIDSGEEKINAKALSSEVVLTKSYKKLIKQSSYNLFFYAKIKGDESSLRTCIFTEEKNTILKKPNIIKSIEKKKDKYIICIESDYFARFAQITINGYDKPLSDNYFDLLPNYKHYIEIDNKDIKIEKLNLKDINIVTLNDVEPKQSKFKDTLYRWHVRLLPYNIINAIAQTFS